MDIWTVLKACIRRWYVFVPILGVALVIANLQVQNAAPVYTATSTAVLTGPALVPGGQPGEIVEVNPFESLGGSMTNTTNIAVALMDSTPKRDEFATQGITLDYTVSNTSSVIYFTVTGSDPAQVTDTATKLITTLDTEVAKLQNKPVDAPESRIRAVPLAVPTSADKDATAGLRMLVVVGVLGLMLATAGALIVEGTVQSRARRAAQRRDDAVAATPWAEHDGARDSRAQHAEERHEADPLGRVNERAPSPFEPAADTAVIGDGPVAAARHGRRA